MSEGFVKFIKLKHRYNNLTGWNKSKLEGNTMYDTYSFYMRGLYVLCICTMMGGFIDKGMIAIGIVQLVFVFICFNNSKPTKVSVQGLGLTIMSLSTIMIIILFKIITNGN